MAAKRKRRIRKGTTDKARIKRFHERLLKLRANLTRNISYLERNALKAASSKGAPVSHAGSSSGDHNADLGTDSYDQDRMLRMAENGEQELREIDAAIQRIEDGTYGKCESCGKKIPWARLQALPYARLCLKCQEEHERTRITYS